MSLRFNRVLAVLALLALPSVARAGAIRLVSADARGATFEFTLPAHSLAAITRPEGTFWRIAAPGLTGTVAEEGRPVLPAEAALFGMPDGTIASVRVVSQAEAEWTEAAGKELEPLGKTEFRPDGKDLSPTRTFWRDPAFYEGGRAWPAATAELGATGNWRRQHVVSVRVNPFRVDPASRTVRVVTAATIRVDFVPVGTNNRRPGTLDLGTPAPANDKWEGLYERALLNYDAAKAFRIAPKRAVRRLPYESFGTTGAAGTPYDPSAEWSVRVDSTGVWRVTYAQLAARGFSAGVPVAQLALTRRAFASGQSPPFLRQPVPIQVLEDPAGTAGTFDGQDAIVFYAQNFTERENPSEYRQRFGDADFVYVGVSVEPGAARLPEVDGNLGLPAPVKPASFPSYRKYEKRFYFNYLPKDTCASVLSWNDQYLDLAFTDSLTMWTPDVDPAGTVRFRGTWQPYTYNPYQHTIWARWKRPSDGLLTSVATMTWSDKLVQVADTTFAADRIAAGTNRLDWRGYAFLPGDPEGRGSGAALESYEVTYSRLYKAFQNRLDFNSGDAQGDVEIEVDGFTSAAAPVVTVYDVTDSTAARVIHPALRQSAPGVWAASFQDQVAPGTRRRYFALMTPRAIPDAAVAQVPQAYATPIWDPPGRPDIVIVTPEAFRADAERLAAHRRTQGFEVLVAPLGEIWNAFDEGRRSDWAIRRLFAYAFANWDSRFAVLLGDGSDDDRGETSAPAISWVPVHDISGPVGTSNGQELSASEFWYINDLDDSVPSTPCSSSPPDPFPDMAIGRIPAGSPAQATGIVDKIIAYDTSDRLASWRNKVVLVPDDPYSSATFSGDPTTNYCYHFEEEVFETISNVLEDVIKNQGGFRDMDVEQFRMREKLLPLNRPVPGDLNGICQPLSGWGIAKDYVQAYTGPQLRTDLAAGALIFNYQGHGSGSILAHEGLWNALRGDDSVEFMFNEGKPYFFLSFSCHVNQFSGIHEGESGDALGETMVIGPTNPPRPAAGGIASYASTNYELLPTDPSGTNHLNTWLFKALFVDPPHDQLAGQSGARVLLGEALTLGWVRAIPTMYSSAERRAIETYCLLGDPSTPMETGAPRMYATANDQPVVSGTRFQPGAPGDSIAFVVDLVDESRIDDLTLTITGEGARAVDPSEWSTTPSYPDTLNGGAGRRYLLNWNVRPGAKDQDLVISARDRNGLATTFILPLRLEMRLFANGQPISNGDVAPSAGPYQIVVSSPGQLTAADLNLTVDGLVPADLLVTPAPSDTSRRLWTLSWTGAYDTGEHEALVTFPGGITRRVSFLTSSEPRVALRRVFAFPTPFAGPPVTINFTLDADQPATVAFKVYSVSGSLVYQRVEPAVSPGYHQWSWDGRDEKSDEIANGTYLYQVIAQDDRGLKSIERGKLARLR